MKRIILSFILIGFYPSTFSQTITGSQLLEKAIAYHDPNSNWETFSGLLNVVMKTPNKSNRSSEIKIDLPLEYFHVTATRNAVSTEYIIDKNKCTIKLNEKINISDAELKEHNLSCERAIMYKNYYTYIYGLPMKLKDPGTLINETIERKTFKGQNYLVLKVTYNENIGRDIWYFYFNPKTYELEIYQFFKTDETGKLNPNSGEYILLSEITTINDIKMPRNRAWYYNKDDGYLGTDYLKN